MISSWTVGWWLLVGLESAMRWLTLANLLISRFDPLYQTRVQQKCHPMNKVYILCWIVFITCSIRCGSAAVSDSFYASSCISWRRFETKHVSLGWGAIASHIEASLPQMGQTASQPAPFVGILYGRWLSEDMSGEICGVWGNVATKTLSGERLCFRM